MLELPWPPRELSPNARIHFRAKAAAVKAYREQAYWLAKAAGFFDRGGDEPITLRLNFHAPDRRRRDLDNMFAATKSAIDGIADAMEINDHRFGFWLSREAPVKGGKVVVFVGDW